MKRFIIIFIIPLLFSSCDLLTTREPEAPDKPRDNFQIATTPEKLIENLQNSFNDKIAENYIMCFSQDKFNFSPSAGSLLKYSSLQNWDIKSEDLYFKNMINGVEKNSQISLSFSKDVFNRAVDSVNFTAEYLLNIPFVDNQLPKSFTGTVNFTFVKDSTLQWVITRWQDFKKENQPDWSDLKGRLY